MKLTFFIFFALLLPPGAQARGVESPVGGALWFDNVRSQYRSFEEIKPSLINAGPQSVYLKWTHPHGARLERFDDETGQWEAGGKGTDCGTGLGRPIEIKAGESRDVNVEWEMSTDDSENPTFFRLADHDTLRPLGGRYRLILPYAVEVWAMGRSPDRIYYLKSWEFWIVS